MFNNHYTQNNDEISLQIKKNLQESKKKLQRLKKKALFKTVLTALVLAGGIVTAVLVPNPLSAAAVVAATAMLSGAEGIKHTVKRAKTVSKTKKLMELQNKAVDEQLFVSKVKRDLERNPEEASAPPPALIAYPNLRI